MAIDVHILLHNRTCPKEVQSGLEDEMDVLVEDPAAFLAGINLMTFVDNALLSESTRLLLGCFNDSRVWRKTSETGRLTRTIIRRL